MYHHGARIGAWVDFMKRCTLQPIVRGVVVWGRQHQMGYPPMLVGSMQENGLSGIKLEKLCRNSRITIE